MGLKQLLECVYLYGLEGAGGPGLFDKKFKAYLDALLWRDGQPRSGDGLKFVPDFTAGELDSAAVRAFRAGRPMGMKDEYALRAWLKEAQPALFDANFEPSLTSKSPPAGPGHPHGLGEHRVRPRRDAGGRGELPGEEPAQLARGEGERQAGGADLPRRATDKIPRGSTRRSCRA